MHMNEFIKIINEEISNFDFLGNDEFLKVQETNDLLINEELQKQFICDSLLNRNDKIKIIKIGESNITGNWEERTLEEANKLSLEYSLDIEYTYDAVKEPIIFNLTFMSDKIDISVDGWRNSGDGYSAPPEGDSWYDGFDWDDIDVILFTMDGDTVKFIAFEKAPQKIQILFIREFTQNFIENETLEFRTKEQKDNIQNTPYC